MPPIRPQDMMQAHLSKLFLAIVLTFPNAGAAIAQSLPSDAPDIPEDLPSDLPDTIDRTIPERPSDPDEEAPVNIPDEPAPTLNVPGSAGEPAQTDAPAVSFTVE
ncbi:MAG: hypothetical protein ACFB4J_12740, partial [Elainellaceae cyanobacterium]